MKLLKEKLKNLGVPFDMISRDKQRNYIIRKSYFYRNGMSENKMAEILKDKLPESIIVSKGDQFKAFRGGDTIAQGSHFWVKFKFS